MAKWTAATRKAYYKSHPENFAGDGETYPIKDGGDVEDAWDLAGHAADSGAVRAKVKSIAKRLGLTSSLPDTAKEDDAQERSMTKKTEEALTRAADTANHEPFTGKHAHGHGHMDGYDHEHEHEHINDNLHDHKHEHHLTRAVDGNDNTHDHSHSEDRAHEAPTAIPASDRLTMSLPLFRIDATKREVWGQATAEVPDSYGTIFGYYPDAWRSWRGNIREQHDAKKAVGKRFDLECDDLSRAIHVGSRISRGAQDTWLKVEDNVLTGYSASIIPDPEFGSDPKRWPKKEYEGKQYPYLPRYTVAELSLVDNPACPGCNIQIVRADGFATDVLDVEDEQEASPPDAVVSSSSSALERAGARVSSDTKSAMHKSIGHTMHAAVSQMQNCGCDGCSAAMKMIDPDGDGDIDMGGYDDPDSDWQSLYGDSTADTERVIGGIIERILEQKLSAVYARLQGIAGTLARSNAAPAPIPFESIIDGAITRAVEVANTANESSLAEVRASLGAVKEQVDAIANTPVPGAPVMNANALPRPALNKRLSTDPIDDAYARPKTSGSAVADAMRQLSEAGYLNTEQRQVDAMTAGLLLQQQSRGRR